MTDHQRLVGGSSGPETADRPVDGPLETAAQLGRFHGRGKQRVAPPGWPRGAAPTRPTRIASTAGVSGPRSRQRTR